jgi:hypothetical protein
MAKKSVNFKSFLNSTVEDVEVRTMTEQKLMVTAYENRGSLQFQDVVVIATMPKIVGEKFSDPLPSKPHGAAAGGAGAGGATGGAAAAGGGVSKGPPVVVPSGFNLTKIKIALQSGLGIVGWQLCWNADCCLPIESAIRGKVVGSSITQCEYHLKPFDFLLEIEYCTEGAVMVGIRFSSYLNGWSKWIGNKGNQLSKKYRLSCTVPGSAAAPRSASASGGTRGRGGGSGGGGGDGAVSTGEPVYKPGGERERRSPGMPWEYIIGFCGLESTVRATSLGIVVRRVSLQNIFSYHWVNESSHFIKLKQITELQQAKAAAASAGAGEGGEFSLPPLLPSSSNVGTTAVAATGVTTPPPTTVAAALAAARPTSPSQKRSMDLLRHLSDLQTELGYPDPSSSTSGHPYPYPYPPAPPLNETDYLDVDESPTQLLTPSEEQFFDVLRMRAVEIKAAEARVMSFARHLWTNHKIRFHPTLHIFSNLRVLAPLVRWLLETLCKSLVQRPQDPHCLSKLYTSIHYAQVELEILENRLLNAIASIETTEKSEKTKPWYGKVLLGPQLRAQKKGFHDFIGSLKENKIALEKKIAVVQQNIISFQEEADLKMPKFSLSAMLCGNFRIKINAARYKSNLLEKMTMESLKEHLGGVKSSTTPSAVSSVTGGVGVSGFASGAGKFSEIDQDKIREARNKLTSSVTDFEMKSLYQITSDSEDEVRHSRNSVAELFEKTSFPFIQLRSVTAPLPTEVSSAVALPQDFSMTQGGNRKKSFRKSVAVNPHWGNTSNLTSVVGRRHSVQQTQTLRQTQTKLRRIDSRLHQQQQQQAGSSMER